MERRADQRVLDSIGKPIAVQQIGLLSGSQLVQRRIQFRQLFFLDVNLLRRLGMGVSYGFDPQHPFIIGQNVIQIYSLEAGAVFLIHHPLLK